KLVVVDYQDFHRMAESADVVGGAFKSCFRDRKDYAEGRTVTRAAGHLNPSTVPLNDAVADRQPQSHPLCSFGCKKGLKDPLSDGPAHPDAAVGESDVDLRVTHLARDRQQSALGHRIERVQDDVDKHLSELRGGASSDGQRLEPQLYLVGQPAGLGI